jgi:hypothetical protein
VALNPALANRFVFITEGAPDGAAGRFVQSTHRPVLQKRATQDDLCQGLARVLESSSQHMQ